jgi:hypothetical protein
MKNYKVEQIKNENGTFSYLIDGRVFTKQSKRDYSYCLVEVGIFSSSLKSIQSAQSFWYKNGNEGVNKDNLFISEIVKN